MTASARRERKSSATQDIDRSARAVRCIAESRQIAHSQGVDYCIAILAITHKANRCILLALTAVGLLDLIMQRRLTGLDKSLASRTISLHFSEIKGPILGYLRPTPLGERMKDRIDLSTHLVLLAHADSPVPA